MNEHLIPIIYTVICLAINVLTFKSLVKHNRAEEQRRNKWLGRQEYKFRMMWKVFAEDHNLPLNGEEEKE